MKKIKQLQNRRKIWLKIHLWLGLSLGLLLSIYGLTGSILVFHAEIEEWLNPDLLTVEVPQEQAQYRSLETIFAAGSKVLPPSAKHVFATYPRNAQAAFRLNYAWQAPSGILENWEVAVDPYTAEVTGKRFRGSEDSLLPETFMDFIFTLHYALLIKDNALSSLVVGISAFLLIISVLTGLIVWWPLGAKWLSALTIKRGASFERFNYDVHKTSGFYAAIVLLAVLFSGIYMVRPQNIVPVIELFSPVTYRYWFKSSQAAQQAPISMATAVEIANSQYPQGRPHWIYGAPEGLMTFTVCKDGVNRPGSWLQRVCIVIDRYSGNILDVDDPAKGRAGEIFTHWQWPLHSGQAFGWTGRILVFLSGLACPVLFGSGGLRWSQKNRAKRVKRSYSYK